MLVFLHDGPRSSGTSQRLGYLTSRSDICSRCSVAGRLPPALYDGRTDGRRQSSTRLDQWLPRRPLLRYTCGLQFVNAALLSPRTRLYQHNRIYMLTLIVNKRHFEPDIANSGANSTPTYYVFCYVVSEARSRKILRDHATDVTLAATDWLM